MALIYQTSVVCFDSNSWKVFIVPLLEATILHTLAVVPQTLGILVFTPKLSW